MEMESNQTSLPETTTDYARLISNESARVAWGEVKIGLKERFGEGLFRSYVEPLDLAAQEDGAYVFVAQNGGTQRRWVQDNALDEIRLRLRARLGREVRVRVCEVAELSPLAREAFESRGPAALPARTRGAPGAYRGTFETFCEGPSNRKAAMLARLLANGNATMRTVVFRGQPGVGKTHLVEAIANARLELDPNAKVRLISGQRFSEEFIEAVSRRKDISAFKANVREADLLIIDDVPRLAGRRASEEELYDAITAVVDRGGVAVFTTASSLEGFGDRLAHHFKCATECEIDMPDLALRRRILDVRVAAYAAEETGFVVSPEALDMVASRMCVSGRELEGVVRQLWVEWLDVRRPLDLQTAEAALRLKMAERRVTVEMIKAAVARHHGMSVAELLRKTREKQIALPRQQAMYLATQMTTLSLPRIAQLFGGYDHTTVLHARRKIAGYVSGVSTERKSGEAEQCRRDVETIAQALRQAPI